MVCLSLAEIQGFFGGFLSPAASSCRLRSSLAFFSCSLLAFYSIFLWSSFLEGRWFFLALAAFCFLSFKFSSLLMLC